MKLHDLKSQHTAAMDKADAVLAMAEASGRKEFTPAEDALFKAHMSEAKALAAKIGAVEAKGTLRGQLNGGMLIPGTAGGSIAFDGGPQAGLSVPFSNPVSSIETASPEYMAALVGFLKTGGKAHSEELTVGADGAGGYHVPGSERYTRQRNSNGSFPKASAAMYEGAGGGSDGAGGYAVNIPTVPQIVPLALPDLGIYDASTVLPTLTDVKIPVQASFGTSAIKAESNGTVATFGGTDPSLAQIDLSAYMVGALRLVSWELLQDVGMFQQFVVDDLLKGQRILEGQLLASGTGSGQPLGVFGNTGTGTGAPYALSGASTDSTLLLDSLFDVTAQLKATYQANASWIMARSTGLAIRRAQMQSNLFAPVMTVDADGTERILGRPVYYDVNAPALPTSTTTGVIPILYGDFKTGYLVGVRGGAGINVKILDQPWAAQGQLGILAYRRLDGRVSRSEAIQAITFSHS